MGNIQAILGHLNILFLTFNENNVQGPSFKRKIYISLLTVGLLF